MNKLHDNRKTKEQRLMAKSNHWEKSREAAHVSVLEYVCNSTSMDATQKSVAIHLVAEFHDKYGYLSHVQDELHAKGFNYSGAPLELLGLMSAINAAVTRMNELKKEWRKNLRKNGMI